MSPAVFVTDQILLWRWRGGDKRGREITNKAIKRSVGEGVYKREKSVNKSVRKKKWVKVIGKEVC